MRIANRFLSDQKGSFFRAALVLLPAIALLLTFQVSCATDQRSREMAATHLRSGIANIESEQYTMALRELFQARELDPHDPEIHHYLGIAYWSRGLKNEAFQSFSRAAELQPDYSEAWNYLGLIRFEEGRFTEAVDYFNKALNNVLYETPEFALFNLGRAYREEGNYRQALDIFGEALRIHPNRILPLIHDSRGSLLLSLNRKDEALRHFREAVRLAPEFAAFRYSLGRCLLDMGFPVEAVQELRKVIELAPGSDQAADARTILMELSRN